MNYFSLQMDCAFKLIVMQVINATCNFCSYTAQQNEVKSCRKCAQIFALGSDSAGNTCELTVKHLFLSY